MRISAYAERMLNGLNSIDWPEAMKEMQRNWIGKSIGCELSFEIENFIFQYKSAITLKTAFIMIKTIQSS